MPDTYLSREDRQLIAENWKYYRGDTFQYWNGPRPPAGHPKHTEVMNRLKSIYHGYNIIAEIVDIYSNSLTGNPYNWYLSANGERVDATDAEETLKSWLDFNARLAVSLSSNPLNEAVAQMLVTDNGDGIGIGYLRLYSPKKLRTDPIAHKRVLYHCPSPNSIALDRDDDGFPYKATYAHTRGLETYELLESGKTRITDAYGNISELDLDGNLPVFELRGRSLLTRSLKQAQLSINKTLTLKDQNVEFAGFLERVITNAQLPGRWVKDPEMPTGERFIPDPGGLQLGANSIGWIQGIPIGDPKNPSGYTSPNITYRQPVSCATFTESFMTDRTCAYMEAGLGHLLSAGDGSLSGVSRETIKQDYETRLGTYARNIESVLAGLLSTAARLLNPEWAIYDPIVQLNLATGQPTPEERAATIADLNAGIISRTTAMSRSGIDDVDAESELIKKERLEDFQLLQQQTAIAAQNGGLTP